MIPLPAKKKQEHIPGSALVEPRLPIYPERFLNVALENASDIEVLSAIQDLFDELEFKSGLPKLKDDDFKTFAKAKLEIFNALINEYMCRLDNASWVERQAKRMATARSTKTLDFEAIKEAADSFLDVVEKSWRDIPSKHDVASTLKVAIQKAHDLIEAIDDHKRDSAFAKNGLVKALRKAVGRGVPSKIHVKDDLMAGMTYEELITTLQSNEKVIDRDSAKKVFEEIVDAKMADAMFLFDEHIDMIVDEAKG